MLIGLSLNIFFFWQFRPFLMRECKIKRITIKTNTRFIIIFIWLSYKMVILYLTHTKSQSQYASCVRRSHRRNWIFNILDGLMILRDMKTYAKLSFERSRHIHIVRNLCTYQLRRCCVLDNIFYSLCVVDNTFVCLYWILCK